MGNLANRMAYNDRLKKEKEPKRRKPAKKDLGKLKEAIEKIPRTDPLPIVTRDAPASSRGRPGSGRKVVSIRLDQEIIDHFQTSGDGWQKRVNDVLRDYVRKV